MSLAPDNGFTADILNFARLTFTIEKDGLGSPKMFGLLCSKKTIENALAIGCEWSSGVRLEIEDLYRTPLFEASLKLVSTDYDQPNPDRITRSLEKLRGSNSSTAIIITRYPGVVTCLRLQIPTQDVFVLLNPRVSSEHERVACLTFSTSLPYIVQQV